MKKTATRWAAIAAGALGATLLVAPGASADPAALGLELTPVQHVPAQAPAQDVTVPGAPADTSDPGEVGVLVPDDGGSYTIFGRWDDELI